MARDGSVLVKFIADTLGFRKGTTDMGDALKDAERVTSTSTTHMSDAFRDAGTKIHKTTDSVHKETVSKFGAMGTEAGGSLGQNFGSAIGQGGTSSIPDALFGMAGDLAQSIPVAGPMVAVGGAIILALVNGINANAAAARQAVKDAYTAAANEILNGPKIETLSDVIGALSPEDLDTLKRAGIAIYDYADAVIAAEKGNPAKLDALRTRMDELARASAVAGAAGNRYAAGTVPAMAAAAAASLDILNRQTGALRAQEAAYLALMRAADLAAQAEWRRAHPAAGGSPFPKGVDQP